MSAMLVTGGMGFIGSNFIRHMLEHHPHVPIINLDLLTYAGNKDNVEAISNHPNYSFIQGDIADAAFVDMVIQQGITTVVNFAAESHVDRSIQTPQQFVNTNISGTFNLLQSARKHDVKKFVQISTDEVYGSLDDVGLFTEETALAPNSPYSASKASADLLARAFAHTYQFPVVITRCSNNYGPRQFPEKLIPMTIIRALHDEPIPIYGDGQNIRDWLHVSDHCRAIFCVIEHGLPGDVYNIGGNNERKNIDIVKLILHELGKPESLIQYVTDRLGHDRRYAIDATKIRNALNWEPKYSVDAGMKEVISWYVNNEQWWKKLMKRSLP